MDSSATPVLVLNGWTALVLHFIRETVQNKVLTTGLPVYRPYPDVYSKEVMVGVHCVAVL
jgi:hypothetical protein